MTRKKDKILEGEGSSKIEDMKERVRIINDGKEALAVSIHQNSYHDPGIRGAQVFYYKGSEKGRKAAELIQDRLLEMDQNNHRTAKENHTYYLLKRTKVPTVIVECGFLSNQEEAELLESKAYQEKLAEAILLGIQAYVEN